ncbi:efflux RND transporter permease subunit [Sediminicola sp. 1XM1-17]|uniref:efflux RND transporter permease subunit n=1 Tax=Sediminicola sp. 1XM1-17 TaxID=3127702 RepID=UPI003076D2E0
MEQLIGYKKYIVSVFVLLALAAGFSLTGLKFSFDLQPFFPEGDEELELYQDFVSEFGTDDSYLFIAIESDSTVFNTGFLERFHQFSMDAKTLPHIRRSESLTTLSYPLKTSFGYTGLPIIHREDTTAYKEDWKRIREENIFVNSFIDTKASSMVVVLETEEHLDYGQSKELLGSMEQLLESHSLENYHVLGRAPFYKAIVELQKSELLFTTIASSVLVILLLFLIYRKAAIIGIAFASIGISLLLFLGVVVVMGKELTALSAFYPILILIVGVSDVIHLMDKYLQELNAGKNKVSAMLITLKSVGVPTFLTSMTTALGFLSLLTSKLEGIRDFGLISAIGVMVTFVTVMLLGSALLVLVHKRYLLRENVGYSWSSGKLLWIQKFTKNHGRAIMVGSLVFGIICLVGVYNINTNYRFYKSLPKNSSIASDFEFFQTNYAGSRPLEVAVIAKKGHTVSDYGVLMEMDKLEGRLQQEAAIRSVQSVTTFYKFANKAHNLNQSSYYRLPDTQEEYDLLARDVQKLSRKRYSKFVNQDGSKARITARVLDVGSDSLVNMYKDINRFIATQTDSSLVGFTLTGKGYLLDTNANDVRNNILQGLLAAIFLVGLLMAFIFKDLKLLFISIAVNMFPLLFCGALLGFLDIPLEATISIVFALVFGISVDDTIHFLSKYRICLAEGLPKEQALGKTFSETGRALVITTVILFFGFAVMLFSNNEPSMIIGLLAAVTLLSALVFDLLLLPVLIRKYL